MDKCDITGGILSLGLNKFAESEGLPTIPAGAGTAYDLNPGYIVKQEVKGLCTPNTASLLTLDLSTLSLFAQGYLMDRMKAISSAEQDKSLKIPGTRVESPSFSLGAIHLPATGTAVIWYDTNKPGPAQVEWRPAQAHI